MLPCVLLCTFCPRGTAFRFLVGQGNVSGGTGWRERVGELPGRSNPVFELKSVLFLILHVRRRRLWSGLELGPEDRRGGARPTFSGCRPGADAGVSGARAALPPAAQAAGRPAAARALLSPFMSARGRELPAPAAAREQCAASCRPAGPRPRSRSPPWAAGKWPEPGRPRRYTGSRPGRRQRPGGA